MSEGERIEVIPGSYAADARSFLLWSFARAADGETTSATDIIARDALVDAKSAAQIAAMQRLLSQRVYAVASKWLRDRDMIDDAGYTFYQGGPAWFRLDDEGNATPDPEWTAARVAEQEATRGGMLDLDADFADLLDTIHPQTASEYRDWSKNRWARGAHIAWAHWSWPRKLAVPLYPKALLALGIALWHGDPAINIERKRLREAKDRSRKAPAVPLTLTKALVTSPRELTIDEDRSIGSTGLTLAPGVDLATARAMVPQTFDLVLFWDLFAWIYHQNFNRWVESGDSASNTITIRNGWKGLAEALGKSAGKTTNDPLRAALDVGRMIDGADFGGLWTWYQEGKRGPVSITVGDVLRQGYVLSQPSDRRLLAPVANPASMPRLVGNRSTYARQRAADQALMNLAAERSIDGELDGERFVFRFDRDRDRKEIADTVDLYRRSHADASSKWLDRLQEGDAQAALPLDGAHSGPVIELLDGEHAALLYPPAVALLGEQSKRRQRARNRGKASARAKASDSKGLRAKK